MEIIPKSSVEPWYWGYAFQGAVVLGTAPILIPIIVAKSGGAAHAGAVVAAFYLGQLTAPLWGMVADWTRLYRVFFLSGFVLLAIGLGVFAGTSALGLWFILAFIQGSGAAVSNTVAGMNIVEFKPREEWEPRIGWLQTMYGAGQTIGLALAALLQKWPEAGMVVSALLMAPGALLGNRDLPQKALQKSKEVESLNHRRLRLPRNILHGLHNYHRPSLKAVGHILQPWRSPFGLFLAGWFTVMFGTWTVYNLYPLVMKEVYGIGAGLSSLYYALAAGIGVYFYAASGSWGKRIGDINVYLIGIVMTLVSVGLLSILIFFGEGIDFWLAPASFIIMPVAWSPLIVAGLALTAQLTPFGQGEAMGAFTACTAIGSVLSALLAGALADKLGYWVIPPVATAFTIVGLGLALKLRTDQQTNT
jgi:MFS family permease